MQLYALSTGNFVKGALSMFLFSVGTLPLMLGLSVLSSLLSKKFTRGMMTVGATLVVVLGVAMFGNGMNLSGFSAFSAFAPNAAARARVEGDIQVVRTELAPGRYEPIAVQVGIPVRWTIHAEPGTVNGCNNRIIIPEYGRMQKTLGVGDNVVEFTPTRSGYFVYTCWMGMIRGRITVLDEAGNGDFDDKVLTAELPPDVLAEIADATSGDFDLFELFDAVGGAALGGAAIGGAAASEAVSEAALGDTAASAAGSKAEENPRCFRSMMTNTMPCCRPPVQATAVAPGPRRVQVRRTCH
jgi:hypothetical protein